MKKIRTVIVRTFYIYIVPAIALAQDDTFKNPSSLPDIQSFLANFLKAIVQIALPIITLFVVYSGFLFIAARGNEVKITQAKNNFLYVIIGATLILGAWILATLLGATAKSVLPTS